MSDHTPLTRRSVLRTTGVAAGLGLVGSGAASLSQEGSTSGTADSTLDATTDWPQFQGNAAKTGVAGGGPTAPDVRWEYGRETGTVYSQPAVEDGTVYVPYFDEADGESGSAEAGVVALTTDGEEQWRFRGGPDIALGSAPAVADGLVFATGETSSREECKENDTEAGLLLALDAATGEEVYRRTVRGSGAKAPTVADGSVYVVVPGTGIVMEGTLVAYDATSGTEQWRTSTGGYGLATHKEPPVSVADGRVFVAENSMAAFDAESGEELWRTGTYQLKGRDNQNVPVVVDGTVYVGTGAEEGVFYAISADDGSIEWTRDAASNAFSAAAVTGDTVYVSMESTDDPPEGVLALSTEDGSKKWLAEGVSRLVEPIRGDQYVYVGCDALSPEDGSIAWSLGRDNRWAAVAGETLYMGGPSVIAVGGG